LLEAIRLAVTRTIRYSLSLRQVEDLLFAGEIHNHFNHDRHLNRSDVFKQNRSAALAEWRQPAAGHRGCRAFLRLFLLD